MTTRETRLCIGTHVATITSVKNRDYLAVVHQSVCSPTSPISLHSSAQLHEHRIYVNNRSRRQADEAGNPRKQCRTFPGEATFPMRVRNGLMTIDIRPRTHDDLKRLPRVELTGSEKWYPQKLYNDPCGLEQAVSPMDNA